MEKYRVPNRYRDIFGYTDPEYRTELEKNTDRNTEKPTPTSKLTPTHIQLNQLINQSIKQF